jgi:hypothetical protein
VETVWTGQTHPETAPVYPQKVQCKTCHDFHKSLDFENEPNSAISMEDEVTLMAYDTEITLGYDNTESNLCMYCHMARKQAFDDSEPTRRDTIPGHFGPHYSAQADFINGIGGYEFGVVLSTTGTHLSGSDCVACHMTETAADTTGGHTFSPGVESCSGCHPDAAALETASNDLHDLLVDLQDALFAAGMIDADGDPFESDEGDPDADPPEPAVWVSYEADSAGALWNYLYLHEDGSEGIHNPAYAKALIQNSLNALQ